MDYIPNVTTIQVFPEKCIGCKKCLEVCPRNVISLRQGKVNIDRLDACIECGACQKNCPTSAISVKAGVGCANAILKSIWRGDTENCVCGEQPEDCC